MSSAITTLHPLADGSVPEWVSGWGEDRWGPFVEITIAEVQQRMRWIPAGRFQMGSPDDEPGRAENEGPQHWVDITRGYWLFDTPVTQELWEAVMGTEENRSEFRHKHRPVENVSWDDCQQFFERCREVFPAVELCLPTEAEWEYACRAGTTEATYGGPMELLGTSNAPVLDAISWYDGNCGVDWDLDNGYDTTGSAWSETQYEFDRGGTGIVATRTPNPWGLYDMLGNVWEWCQDVWSREYTAESVADPLHEPDDVADRVIRGGSWGSLARNVRAAYRGRLSPDGRNHNIGFRCRVR